MKRLLSALCLILPAAYVLAQEPAAEQIPAPTAQPLPVQEALLAGPIPLAMPAFFDEAQAGVKPADLLQAMPAVPGEGWPGPGRGFRAPDGRDLAWTPARAEDGAFAFAAAAGPTVRYLSFVIAADRWLKATLTVSSLQEVRASLDGADLALDKGKAAADSTARTAELTLPIGKHLVCLRALDDPAGAGGGPIRLAVAPADSAPAEAIALGIAAERPVDIHTVLDAPRIAAAALSPDGGLVALTLGAYPNGKDKESWLEVRDTAGGKLLWTWRGPEAPSAVAWHPQGRRLSWRVDRDEKATVWMYDLDAGTTEAVLRDVQKLGAWRWAPDGASLVYEIGRSPEPDKRKVKRVMTPADRQPWWRDRAYLEQAFVPGGLTRRLTAGPVSPQSWTLSPDGRQLLFFTSEPDLDERPFATSDLWLMDLSTLQARKILSDPWVGGAEFSPDGKMLCLQGSPSAFDGLGRVLPAGVQANDYGGQLYLFAPLTGQAEAITRDFGPDVDWFAWCRADGMIYAVVSETQYGNVYRRARDGRWEKLDTQMECTDQIALPLQGRTAVARGTSATVPNRLYALDLKKNAARLLLDPGAKDYRDIIFGEIRDWTAVLPDGERIDGYVYLPPDFDPARTYPLIVYYYGGTSPITRDYGGRYPKNIWAGQGYVVYVPNPSGATGYGQEFAARHVNDWGKLTAAEVIGAARAFVQAHPFVDPARVGCIGASYGGFLTEYILTRTDMFAAGVSHAGISDISSYWGEGLWGYEYGARALAGSFPWRDRELFVEQSPLFHADKITTPLLLLHGDADTNVPKGESDQLFTALKLLGRDVEYVQIQGQDHHILDHEQRIVWNDTILAYFAKYLKGQPQWWDALYPAPEDWR